MAIYYMRADGQASVFAANAANGGSPNFQTTAMSVATHNAYTSPGFQAGDIIYISEQGGTYTRTYAPNGIRPPSDGAGGEQWAGYNPITYAAVPGETPIIDLSWDKSAAQNTGALWTIYSGNPNVYTTTSNGAYYARVLWEDGVPLKSTEALVNSGVGYECNGVKTVYAYTFKIWYDTGILVYLHEISTGNEYLQTLNTNYTVSGAGNAGGGNVTFTSPPSAAYRVILTKDQRECQGPGSWHYQAGFMYYYPTTNTPAAHDLKTIWFENEKTPFGFDMRDRSNLDVSGLTFNYCGLGHSSVVQDAVVKNNKIHHNFFNYMFFPLWGQILKNAISQDFEIYNNTFYYCNSGILTWVNDSDSKDPHADNGHPLRHNIHHNTINHLYSIDPTHDWTFALLNTYLYIDHEGISYQDMVECTVADNTVTCDVAVDNLLQINWRRAFILYTTISDVKLVGNKILRNRFIGPYFTSILIDGPLYPGGTYSAGGLYGTVIAFNVLESTDATKQYNNGIKVWAINSVNPETRMNYIYNNTINYPISGTDSTGVEIINDGAWTVTNNIINARRVELLYGTFDVANYVYSYNNYYSSLDIGAFYYNGSSNYGFNAWKSIDPDFDNAGPNATHSGTNPQLDSNSAITASSPSWCINGGTSIDWSVWETETGLAFSAADRLGIDGNAFASPPSMGAYAQIPSVVSNTNYSRYFYASLPGTDADLITIYSGADITAVSSDDGIYVSQGATAPNYAVHEFKTDATGKSVVTLTWDGQTNVACTTSTVYLQIYNQSTGYWENAPGLNASNSTTGANTDFTLTSTVSGLDDYKDTNGIITCRVYQKAQ